MGKVEWILCPVCGSKTRNKVREDTVLKNYPLYLTSTCGVESPLVLARIFLTGYPSLYIVYENRNCYLQAI